MTGSPHTGDWPAPPVFPPRRAPPTAGAATSPVEAYLEALADCLAGQIDPALEAGGIVTPLGSVARAAIVEAIGADLEAAVRDLMLAGLPRAEAEAKAVANLGPAPLLGTDLLVARRRRAVEAWERGGHSVWWWMAPLVPVGLAVFGVLIAALAPTIAVIAGMAAEPRLGTLAATLVPLVIGLLIWVAGALAPDIGGKPPSSR